MQPSALLSLIWLASPALPVGGFSYSEGLEAAVDAGLVHDEISAGQWLSDQLDLVLSRSELPLLAQALRAWAEADESEVARCNEWLRHTRESAEFRLQAEQMGRSLLQWLRQQAQGEDERWQMLSGLAGGPTWPVAFALAGWRSGADERSVLLAFAFAWAENMVQAAIKAVPLGQASGQRMLALLAEQIPEAAERALALSPQDRQAYAPMLAILSARHEHQYSRLFRS